MRLPSGREPPESQAVFSIMLLICSPTTLETWKIVETGMNDATLYLPIAANPAEAIHPHSVQTGSPPN
jgi:hypothetical protein